MSWGFGHTDIGRRQHITSWKFSFNCKSHKLWKNETHLFLFYSFLGKTLLCTYTAICFIFSCRWIDSFGNVQHCKLVLVRLFRHNQLDQMVSKLALKVWILWCLAITTTGSHDPPFWLWVSSLLGLTMVYPDTFSHWTTNELLCSPLGQFPSEGGRTFLALVVYIFGIFWWWISHGIFSCIILLKGEVDLPPTCSPNISLLFHMYLIPEKEEPVTHVYI